jgi:carboxymethylenebutenolidase
MLKDKLAGRVIDIATRDGRTMAAELFAKPGAAGPGIVMVPAVFGIDDDARIIAWDYVQDLGYAVEQFRRMTECNGKVAVFGYCFGGRYAYLAAAHGIADAAVSFHGTKIGLDLAKAAAIASPLQLHCGAVDPQVPMEEVERTKQALAGNSQAQIFVYPGAAHGFTGKGRPSYQEVADVGSRHAALALLGLLR